jgi:hypothetical protein
VPFHVYRPLPLCLVHMITVPFFFSSPPFIVLLHGANFHLAAFDAISNDSLTWEDHCTPSFEVVEAKPSRRKSKGNLTNYIIVFHFMTHLVC